MLIHKHVYYQNGLVQLKFYENRLRNKRLKQCDRVTIQRCPHLNAIIEY